jgi:Glycosyl-transferase for dystroglycan
MAAAAWAHRLTQQRACALDVTLFSELLPRGDPWMGMLFPVNAMRNRALLLARTQLVMIVDGDMLVERGMHAGLAADAHRCGPPAGWVCARHVLSVWQECLPFHLVPRAELLSG